MSRTTTNSRRDFLKGAAVVGGASTLGACVGAQSGPSVTHTHSPSFYPKHNERTKGWMRFMWQKATTPDDWAYSEDIERPVGHKPAPWRDRLDGRWQWPPSLVGSIQLRHQC